jgi:hypothetical protein
MNVNDLYELFLFIINKSLGGTLTQDEFNTIINRSQVSFLNYLLGQFVSYQYGKPLSRVQFGMNEIVRQRITPLIDTPIPLTIDATGLAPYPTDFEQVDAVYTSTMDRVRFVPQHKLYSYLSSVIDPVATNPIFLIENDGFRFYPNTNFNSLGLTGVTLSYVHTPPAIVWNSTPDGQGRPQYDAGTSVDPVWYQVDWMELVSRGLAMVGVNLQANEISQYAQQIKTQGD